MLEENDNAVAGSSIQAEWTKVMHLLYFFIYKNLHWYFVLFYACPSYTYLLRILKQTKSLNGLHVVKTGH